MNGKGHGVYGRRIAAALVFGAVGALLLAGGVLAWTASPSTAPDEAGEGAGPECADPSGHSDIPAKMHPAKFAKARAVGEHETFRIDGSSFNTSCAQVGRHCVIFIEEGVRVDPAAITELRQDFDEVVYPLVTDTFGAETDVDGEERVYIAIVSGGGGWAGVFDPLSLLSLNHKDVFYLDPKRASGAGFAATAAHEFQHLVHCGHDFDEGYMIDEGCSIYAELLYANFSTKYLPEFDIYRQHPEVSLQWLADEYLERRNMGAHYGASGLWILYLSEQYGDLSGDPVHAHFIRDLVDEHANGFEGVDAVLARHGYDERSEDVFKNWTIANYLDDTGVNPRYGYESIDFAAAVPVEATVEFNAPELKDGSHSFPPVTLPAWSAAYYTIGSDDVGNLSYTCEENCWCQCIEEVNRTATVVVSPLNVSGDVVLTVHAEGAREHTREKYPSPGM
ncbi:MAG: hypothetical protein QCH35_07340 [Methanomicrobiaceae archaeon]|nr:hypothetical protein [Methanomicrobiaceae archaeon]